MKPFFHSYIRLPENEELFREQWKHVADRIEKQLGFEGQGRAIAFHHQPGGNTHMHIAWSRIDLEQRRARDPGLYKNKLKEIARQLECELGLTRISSERPAGRKTRAPGRKEFEQARRLGTGIAGIREAIRACWDSADNGRSFMAALAAHGLVLARGERRDFVIIDHAGGLHALSKRITGATAAEIRTRLADLDPAALPTVSQAKTQQAENLPLDIRNGALTVQPSAVPPVPLKHGGDGKASSSEMAKFHNFVSAAVRITGTGDHCRHAARARGRRAAGSCGGFRMYPSSGEQRQRPPQALLRHENHGSLPPANW